MASKKRPYTAAHIYGGSDFKTASSAATPAYTSEAYKCPHSQRSFLAHYNEFGQRVQEDAAVTTCCEEPVRLLSSKPAYQSTAGPATIKDCQPAKKDTGCRNFEVGRMPSGDYVCGSGANLKYSIRAKCLRACQPFSGMSVGDHVDGAYGAFTIVGYEPFTYEAVLNYQTFDATLDDVYNHCSGIVPYIEELCGHFMGYTVRAGLDMPSGCRCDCCNVNGHFSSPTHTWSDPSVPAATWENSITVTGDVDLDTACYDGYITGIYTATGMSAVTMSWAVTPYYVSDGTTHYIHGHDPYFGDSTHPACCGGTYKFSGADGCGWTGDHSHTLAKKPGTMTTTITNPSSGWLVGDTPTITVNEVCNHSSTANLEFYSSSCVASGLGALDTSVDGKVTRIADALALTNTTACKKCCGYGGFSIKGSNGCGDQSELLGVSIGNPHSSSSLKIGSVYKCDADGAHYHRYYRDLLCDGSESGSWTQADSYEWTSISSCVDGLAVTQTTFWNDQCDNSSKCPGATPSECCRYSNNGGSDTSYRAAILCAQYTGSEKYCCYDPSGHSSSTFYSFRYVSSCCPDYNGTYYYWGYRY